MRKPIMMAALLPLLLAGCGGGEAPAPGGVTQSEAQALDDAAEILLGQARILDGETPDDPAAFAAALDRLLVGAVK